MKPSSISQFWIEPPAKFFRFGKTEQKTPFAEMAAKESIFELDGFKIAHSTQNRVAYPMLF